MANIQSVTTGFYRIPLPEILTDSMHGIMRDFELITVRVRDAEGAEGVGYTFTVGRNGGATANILESEMTPLVIGRDADGIEAIWHMLWWELHYGGRGGPTVLALSALDMALWDLKAREARPATVEAARRVFGPGELLRRRHRSDAAASRSDQADRA